MWLIQIFFYINDDALCGTFCTLHCINIFGNMLRVDFFQVFFINLLVSIFSVKILYLGNYYESFTDICFVLFLDMSSVSLCS